MLEIAFFDAERKQRFWMVFFICLMVSFGLGFVNYFIGGISVFLIAFVCLAFSYPITKYMRELNFKNMDRFYYKKFFQRFDQEIFIFWAVFVGVVIGFYLTNVIGLTSDFQYEKSFVGALNGNIILDNFFYSVFFNNLSVAFYTFILSFFLFSGLIFVVVWNASIVAYYLFSLNSHGLATLTGLGFLVHALLEIGGYVWAGIFGAVLSHRIAVRYFGYGKLPSFKRKKVMDRTFVLDCFLFLVLSIGFIFFGAVVETL